MVLSLGLGGSQGWAEPLELRTEGFSLKVIPERAWTYSRIGYREAELGVERGFYGAVLATGPAQFIGTGHDEGGVEKVEEVEIEIDGRPWNPQERGVIQCREARIIKRSRMGILEHVAETHLQAERIALRHRFEAEESGFLELLYPFMFCWSPETTHWFAQTVEGEELEGEFTSEGGWHLERDVRFTSVYHPGAKVAIVARYPRDFPLGRLHRHGYWDREVYHKQYFQALWREEVEQGAQYDFRMELLPVLAAPQEWKERVIETLRAE